MDDIKDPGEEHPVSVVESETQKTKTGGDEKISEPPLSPKDEGSDRKEEDGQQQEKDVPTSQASKTDSDTGFKKPILGPIRKPTDTTRKTDDASNIIKISHSQPTKAELNTNSETPVTQSEDGTDSQSLDANKDEEKQASSDDKEPGNAEESEKSTKETSDKKKLPSKEKIGPAPAPAALPYLEPKWGGKAEKNYSLEVLKNGKIIDNVNLEKSYYVFGRLPQCDVAMEHPSLSRFHAIIQHCAEPSERHELGWYVYDLESTHGTFVNKKQIRPRTYYRLKVGFVVKFAGSSRLHILQGPPEDEEPESDLTVTELKELRDKKIEKAERADDEEEEDEEEETTKKEEDTGCSWGMGEDAQEQELDITFADATPQHEELYLDDPKKALKGYFEREGYDLPEYQFEEAGHGKHKCIVEVPVDSPSGQPVYAEATVGGKRKDAVVACALEACRILDRYGLLRKKDHEARKVKTRDWEANDYYSSDEDEYLDRTGHIQAKREQRMKRAGKVTDKIETYESLSEKLAKVTEEMDRINKDLEAARKVTSKLDGAGLDALDAYMASIKEGAVDTKTKMALKRRLFDLKKERGQLERLVNIAKPATIKTSLSKSHISTSSMFGRIGGFKKIIGKGVVKSSSVKFEAKEAERVEVPEKKKEKEQKMETQDVEKIVPAKPESPPRVPALPEDGLSTKGSEENPDGEEKVKIATPDAPTQKVTSRTQASNIPENPKSSEDSQLKPSRKRVSSSLQQTIKRLKGPEVKKKEVSKDYSDYDDPDYAVWVPPKDQTGDGKTHLNAKFGY